MLTLSTHLTKKEYTSMISYYLTSKKRYRIISLLLILLIAYATISKVINNDFSQITLLGFWWLLGIIYIFALPLLMKSRAATIYNNTLFLSHNMTFEFHKEYITWSTINGSNNFPYNHMSCITNSKNLLIIVFSPYQILGIPYKDISLDQWKEIIQLLPTLPVKNSVKASLYNKYYTY